MMGSVKERREKTPGEKFQFNFSPVELLPGAGAKNPQILDTFQHVLLLEV